MRQTGARALSGSALVIAYHRVGEAEADPFGLCVPPPRFAEQMEVLGRTCRPVSLSALLTESARGRIPPRSVAVTFDDGYADNLYLARPILERYGVPATVFVATGYLGARREFWWDELERRALGTGALPPHPPAPGGLEAYHEMWRRLFPLPARRRRREMSRLPRPRGPRQAVRPSNRQLLPEELPALVRGGLVEVGAHTVSHPALDLLPPARQGWEIRRSRDRLREILQRPVDLFSYPHGRYSAVTPRLLQAAGFRCGCTIEHHLVHPGTDPFRLPRVVGWGWTGEELERHLAGWFAG